MRPLLDHPPRRIPTDLWAGAGGRETHPRRRIHTPTKSALDRHRETPSLRGGAPVGARPPADGAFAGLGAPSRSELGLPLGLRDTKAWGLIRCGGPETAQQAPEEGLGLLPNTLLIYPPTSGQESAGGRRIRGAGSKTRLIHPSDRGGEPPQRRDPRRQRHRMPIST